MSTIVEEIVPLNGDTIADSQPLTGIQPFLLYPQIKNRPPVSRWPVLSENAISNSFMPCEISTG